MHFASAHLDPRELGGLSPISNMRLIIGLSLCLLPSIIIADDAQLGVDISVLLTSDAATCLADAGITSVTPRGFRSSGVIDDNACKSLKHAKTANITYRDVYMFPCPTCSATPAEHGACCAGFLSVTLVFSAEIV